MAAVTRSSNSSFPISELPVDALQTVLSFLPLAKKDIATMARISKAFSKKYQEALANHYISSIQTWDCYAFLIMLPHTTKVENRSTTHPQVSIAVTLPPNETIVKVWEIIAKIYPFKKGEIKAFNDHLIISCNESCIQRNLHNASCRADNLNWLDTY